MARTTPARALAGWRGRVRRRRSGRGDASPDHAELLRAAVRAVDAAAAPRVAVLARGDDPGLAGQVRRVWPLAEVREYDVGVGHPELHLALATRGRVDVVLDVAGAPGAVRRFRTAYYHLVVGGVLVAWAPSGDAGERLRDLVRRVRAVRDAGDVRPPLPKVAGFDPRPERRRYLDALAASVRSIDVEGDCVVAVSGAQALAKVREVDLDRLLAQRAGEDRVVAVLPERSFESRCVVRSSDPGDLDRLPRRFEVPPLSLREYHDVLCRRYQILIKGNLVLPETFRRPLDERLTNKGLADWSRDFVADPVWAAREARPLPGAWFLLDNENRAHFGHFVSELVSHLWAWERVRDVEPAARVLVPVSRGRERLLAWQYDLLEAAGVRRDQVVVARGPVRVETLFTSTAMFSMPHYVHPEIRRTWRMIGDALDALDARAPERDYARRIFVSRRTPKRRCTNQVDVEQLFTERGFDVVLPEDVPVAEQVRMFRRAEVVAGFAGSAMFSLALVDGPRHVVLVASEGYTATNEYLMSSVVGHHLDRVLCRPDPPDPRAGRRRTAFNRPFSFDPDREGVFLRRVLDELDA